MGVNGNVKLKFFRNKVSENDIPVFGGLAITPSEMMIMYEQGLPIAASAYQKQYNEGTVNCSWDVDMDRQRSVDINDLWEHNQRVRDELKEQTKRGIKRVKDYKKITED